MSRKFIKILLIYSTFVILSLLYLRDAKGRKIPESALTELDSIIENFTSAESMDIEFYDEDNFYAKFSYTDKIKIFYQLLDTSYSSIEVGIFVVPSQSKVYYVYYLYDYLYNFIIIKTKYGYRFAGTNIFNHGMTHFKLASFIFSKKWVTQDNVSSDCMDLWDDIGQDVLRRQMQNDIWD